MTEKTTVLVPVNVPLMVEVTQHPNGRWSARWNDGNANMSAGVSGRETREEVLIDIAAAIAECFG